MPLSFRRKLRPFGLFFKKLGRKVGASIVRGATFVEKGLAAAIPITEKILGIAEKIPIPTIQKVAGIGREAVGFAKQVQKSIPEVERFGKKLSGNRNNGAKGRRLIRQSKTLR